MNSLLPRPLSIFYEFIGSYNCSWQYRLVRVSSLPNRDIAPGHFQYCKTSTQAPVIPKVLQRWSIFTTYVRFSKHTYEVILNVSLLWGVPRLFDAGKYN
jgi:hypothetical protein